MTTPQAPVPAFPSGPVNPLEAWRAFNRLVADKEDTRHVFDFIRAVNGRSGEANFRRFVASPYGRSLLQERSWLEDRLTDRNWLESQSPDSFARAYLHHLDSEGLHAAGVREAAIDSNPALYERLAREYPEFDTMTYSGQLTHDLYHVLTGYGRDAVGEALLLVFTGVQTGSRGTGWLGRMAGLRIRRERPDWPIGRMMKNAVRMARNAAHLPTTDLTELMPLPLDEARAVLGVRPDPVYARLRAEHDAFALFAVEPAGEARTA